MKLITGPVPFILQPSDADKPDDPLRSTVIAIYPMTRTQEGLWTAYLSAPHHTLYNLTMRYSLSKENEGSTWHTLEAIYRAIALLTRRHGILRSTFHHPNTFHNQPFIAEDDPLSAVPLIHTIVLAERGSSDHKIQELIHSAVDLSTCYAARWAVVTSPSHTDVYLISHHIAVDGSSMSILASEFFDALPTSTDLAPLSIQPFSQAHILEKAYMASQAFHLAEKFWLSQLSGVKPIQWQPEVLMSECAPSSNYREIQTWCCYSKNDLSEWGNRYNTSWFRVVIAVVGLICRSYAISDHGSDHAVFVAFGGRPSSMNASVGHFANALPIRIPFSECLDDNRDMPELLFQSLVKAVSKQMSTAKKHERFSISDLALARSKQGLEMIRPQVAITLSPKLARSECELYPVEGPYDLFFCFLESSDTIELGVIYDSRVLSASNLSALRGHFEDLRDITSKRAMLDLSTLPRLLAHIPRLMPSLDLTCTDAISRSRFHLWFQEQAAAYPDRLAMRCAEKGFFMTYGDLNDEANRIAHYLHIMKISRGTVVMLYMRRGFSLMAWIMAVLKAGAVFAVADQSHPTERTRLIIDIAKPGAFLYDGPGSIFEDLCLPNQIKKIDVNTVSLDDMPISNPVVETMEDDLAYIIFTSGSSGVPKAVDIEHRNLSHFVADSFAAKYTSIGPGSQVLQFATFAFDAAQLEWAQCLSLGGTLCFADVPEALIGDYLADVIDANGITFMHVTPSVLATLPTSRSLSSLRQISVGGEMVSASLIDQWMTRVQVQNAYGPTECTVVIAHQPQPRYRDEKQPAANIIGRPHQHTKVYICDEKFERVLPVGEFGEVCIGGPQVGRGYRGREDLTRSRFATHPQLQERLYRTGDKGRLQPDGTVYLNGRLDREIKLRGYRIDLEDVERKISDAMTDIHAISVQVTPDGSSLCAFVCPGNVNKVALRDWASKHLPRYMVPSIVYCLDKLPFNTNGKTDHKRIKLSIETLISEAQSHSDVVDSRRHYQAAAVPAYGLSQNSLHSSSLLHRTTPVSLEARQLTLESIWNKILGTSGPRLATDDFFGLGGDSIKVHELFHQLHKRFKVAVRITDLFAKATLGAQMELLTCSGASCISPQTDTSELSAANSDTDLDQSPWSYVEVLSVNSDQVQERITTLWLEILNTEPETVNSDFFEIGGNSLTLSRLYREIRQEWSFASIKLADLFRHRTIQTQTGLILRSAAAVGLASTSMRTLSTPPPENISAVPPIPAVPGPYSGDIAIIGIAGRFPGAPTPDSFYKLLSDRREGISTLPNINPALSSLSEELLYIPRKGLIDGIDEFRANFWNLSQDEARRMDPQQRLFLETTFEALQDAGQVLSVERNNTGLCVGASRETWSNVAQTAYGDHFHRTHHEVLTPSISARAAYHLNLHGPNITLNTACSSSTVALSTAVTHLRTRQCDLAVAGGVSIAFPQTGYMTAPGQIFSPSGHCRPFDHRADGTVPADGVGAVVLCRLEDAIRDGKKAYAVISGIAVGSDGATDKAGITMPSSRGHGEIIKRAWLDAGRPEPSRIVYAELHGSGTAIGDAIELEALSIAKSELGYPGTWIVGSNKGNIGNCEAASGIASIIKLCKSMQHGAIPPLQSFEERNPIIDHTQPFDIAEDVTAIAHGDVLCVSSLGLGGIDAHCVLRFPPKGLLRPLEKPYSRPRYPALMAPTKAPSLCKPRVDIPKLLAMCAGNVFSTDVTVDTDLHSLGMDSLKQIRLLHEIKEVLPSFSFRINSFATSPCTPYALARTIPDAAASLTEPDTILPSNFTVLQTGDDPTLCALFAPAGGSCASYISLAKAIATRINATVVALEHPNHGNSSTRVFSVTSLATQYTRHLRLAFPLALELVLVGASFGGIVASEVARQLQSSANAPAIKCLGLLDSPWPEINLGMPAAKHFLRDLFSVASSSNLTSTTSTFPHFSLEVVQAVSQVLADDVVAILADLPAKASAHVGRYDWRKLLEVYVENTMALHEYSQAIGRPVAPDSDLPTLYVQARSSEFATHVEYWRTSMRIMDVMEIDATHAEVCAGYRGDEIAQRLARLMKHGSK